MRKCENTFVILIVVVAIIYILYNNNKENLTMWKGQPMDFNNCKPYCSSYCMSKSVRGPSGLVERQCFVECGKPCCNNKDCPKSCPICEDGICQSGVRAPYS